MIYEHQFGNLSKHADSTVTVGFNFTNDLGDGETLSSETVTVKDEYNNDVTSTIKNSSSTTSPYVYIVVTGGTADRSYEVKIQAVTSDGNILTRYIILDVIGDVSLNPKLGDINANSYVNLEEANKYIKNNFYHGDQWDKLTFEGRKRVLIQAAKDLNMLNYIDRKYFSVQELAFPRNSHEVYEGTASVGTTTTFRGTNLFNSGYNVIPDNYFKYGTVHIEEGDHPREIRYIASSTATEGGGYGTITVSSPFSGSLAASDEYLVFKPLHQEIKDAQCEQALYIIENKLYGFADYINAGISEAELSEMRYRFRTSKLPHKISLKARKLLGRYLRKHLTVGRA